MAFILILDDQPVTCVVLARQLRSAGFDVAYVHDSHAFFATAAEAMPDLVVLDLHIGAEDGRTVLRRFRAISDAPALILSSCDDIAAKVQSLDAGADDYLCKPASMDELSARVRALLRRWQRPSASPLSAPFSLDPQRRLLSVEGAAVELTEVECRLLTTLFAHREQPMSREMLAKAVLKREWRPGERSLDFHVSNLRKKCRQLTGEVDIQPLRGIGYRLVIGNRADEARPAGLG
jgi:DNA-binding response OmpR family regulator